MERTIVISALLNQVQVGIVENNRLVEYYLERDCTERLVSNIYKGRVENVLPGMGAAFIDIGMA
ncbi:MAG TPA: ribonuclease G, partial [Firmicutes bacterium]|nr:ribonuclease G [Bacillota bacterium]